MRDKIEYPYIPAGRTIAYVSFDNEFMRAAKEFARQNSLDRSMPTGSVIVRHGEVIGRGANGSDYHEVHGCERKRLNVPTGEQYELCEGCSPKNHAEIKAINDALRNLDDLTEADLYLWGHWWCCHSCWETINKAKIRNIFLQEGSQIDFNKDVEGNIVGMQFEKGE